MGPAALGPVAVSPAAWEDAEVQALAAAQQAELRARYRDAAEIGTPPSAADVSAVLLARAEDGTPLGCGALRDLGGGIAELKRMYVLPAARGRGVGRAILLGLQEVARRRGWTTLRLEMGRRQPEALRLYTGTGFRPTEPFGAYRGDPAAAGSLFLERAVDSG